MMMKKSLAFFLLAVILAAVLSGCSDTKPNDRMANVQFRLTDVPGEYQQVNIDVVAVELRLNDTLISLPTNQGIYNLLEFVNGKDTLLVDDQLASGFISQIRLILGENNTVMIDNKIHDLKTPSAQQSGLKLNVHKEVIAGETYIYTIDFDVEKSIVETGNGKYILKPVIRVFTEVITGSIQGIVQPAESKALVRAIMENDTISTFTDTISGVFLIRGLSEGSYRMVFTPIEAYQDTTIYDVSVTPGFSTMIDTVFIRQLD